MYQIIGAIGILLALLGVGGVIRQSGDAGKMELVELALAVIFLMIASLIR